MSVLDVALLVAACWTGLSVATALVLLPLLRLIRWAEEPSEAARPARAERHERPERPEPVVTAPPLRGSGYPGIVLERLVLHASTIFGADEVCVFGRDQRGDDALVLAQAAGVSPDLVGSRLAIEWDPMVAALACGRPLAIPGHLWPAWEAERQLEPAHSAAVAPVWFGGRFQGALSVIHRRDGQGLDVSGLSLLGDLAELAGRVLAHTEGRQLSAADPQREIDGLLNSLAQDELGDRDGPDPAIVADWLAEDLGLGEADRLELELGARLHRVGGLRVPAHLSEDLLRHEPLWGAEMVARIPGLEAIALIVRFSRERWDGSGYPDGLAGERIPLASRIIALAEASASLTLGELEARAGSRFDPGLTARLAELGAIDVGRVAIL